jgi:hypothetical protein
MDVRRCRNRQGIPARLWCFGLAHHPKHVFKRGLTGRGNLLKIALVIVHYVWQIGVLLSANGEGRI